MMTGIRVRIKSAAIVSAITTLLGICACNSQKENCSDPMETNATLVFSKGDKITNDNFTGATWLNNLVSPDSINQVAVGSVTFEPGSRTNWHSHPAGQIILALEGEGYYQEEGSTKQMLKKGDVVKCPPDKPHWHGASANQTFVQVAITGRERGETLWLQPVTDEEYHRTPEP